MTYSYFLTHPRRLVLALAERGIIPFVSDKQYIKMAFRAHLGTKLDLDNPVTFNEKMQWLKLNQRDPKYTTMVDKLAVKEFITQKLGAQYVTPTLGVWTAFDQINFDQLPNRFVLKTTHDSGGVVVCRDKNSFDFEHAKELLTKSMNRDYFKHSREWPYKNVPHRIIAEPYLEDKQSNRGLTDYKFYCFNGKVKYLYVSEGLENRSTAQISFLDKDWQFAPFHRLDYAPLDSLPDKPSCYEQMVCIAEQLSEGFDYLRVDLYEIDGKVLFSELTFYPCSGFMPFEPRHYDEVLGNELKLNEFDTH